MFYKFDQNNSGGSFVFDEKRGLTHYVIIEADSLSDACNRAENIGIYFDGCYEGVDCDCCSDRWYRPYKNDGTEWPKILTKGWCPWMPEGKETVIHYLDGRKEWYGIEKAKDFEYEYLK